jgi:hypothetical protein
MKRVCRAAIPLALELVGAAQQAIQSGTETAPRLLVSVQRGAARPFEPGLDNKLLCRVRDIDLVYFLAYY